MVSKNMTILCFLVFLFYLSNAKERKYFIQAQEMEWDFALGLKNGTSENQDTYYLRTASTIGPVYTKCLYRRYTDSTFKHLHPEDDRSPGSKWEHLGFLGPILRGVVGDTLKVHFKNSCSFPASVHCHGVRYLKTSEGADYEKVFPGDIVQPKDSYIYTWDVLERSGPASMDTSNVGWPYHSHVREVTDTYSGLIGVLLIGRDEDSCPDGYPAQTTKEFVTLFMVMDENQSFYLEKNIREKIGINNEKRIQALIANDDFIESNKKHTINGRGYFTLPGLHMTTSDYVRWYVVGMGTEVDIHTAHWHGHTVVRTYQRKDVLDVFPGTIQVGDMRPDTPGVWMYHCHVGDHILAGMMANYVVSGPVRGFE